jgi:hypothetical protein
LKQIRRHFTYANVMSSVAVFLILGGATAFAATKIGANQLKANSVKTGKIVKEAVTAGKIKNGAVTETKIADAAVTTNKLADNAVTTLKIADLAVTTGKIANDAVNGEKVNESTLSQVPSAKVAETAAPQAYARVLNNAGGLGVDEARSKGVTDASVTFVGGSVYCFELGFTPKNIQATIDWIGGGANTFAHATLEPFAVCPAGTDASVRTTTNAGGGLETADFYVQFVG